MSSTIINTLLCFILFMLPITAHSTENEECMECHSDSAMERSESKGVNLSINIDDRRFKYSSHNINGITCVDCHADIGELNYEEEVPHPVSLAPVVCAECHEAQVEAFKKSVHYKSSAKGINIKCYACHSYHYETSSIAMSVSERENKSCLNCHDPFEYHNWLPQKDSHFDFVQCSVCHSPDAPRHIHLRFYDLVQKEFLLSESIFKTLGTDIDGFMPFLDKDKDEMLNVEEFENMVFLLKKRGIHATFHGELLSEQEPLVHNITQERAKRECNTCHKPDSLFFNEVTLFFGGSDGSGNHFLVDRKVLATYSVRNFYAPGGTRVRELDYIGILFVGVTISGVLLHLLVRIATVSIRKKVG